MTNEKKRGSIALLILGILLFLALFGAQGALNRSGNGQLSGIIAQLQVLVSTFLVVTNSKRGFIAAVILNAFNALFVAVTQVLLGGNLGALPGVVVSIVTIFIVLLIYLYLSRAQKAHDDLTESYNQLIENNRIMQEKDEELTYLAYYDRATGLPNRVFFIDKMTDYMEHSVPFVLISMDADNFKEINDRFGHQIGDQLIKTYAERLEQHCGDRMTCALIEGDQFGVLLEGRYAEADVLNIIEDFRRLFAQPANAGGTSFSITMSYGICSYPNDARTPDVLMNAAETALYNAKIAGKNRPVIFSQQSLG